MHRCGCKIYSIRWYELVKFSIQQLNKNPWSDIETILDMIMYRALARTRQTSLSMTNLTA
jgi:hypothetical protein